MWQRKLVTVLWVVLFSVLDPENTRIIVCCFWIIFWEVKCRTSLSKQKVELCSCLWFYSFPLLPMRLFYMLPSINKSVTWKGMIFFHPSLLGDFLVATGWLWYVWDLLLIWTLSTLSWTATNLNGDGAGQNPWSGVNQSLHQ